MQVLEKQGQGLEGVGAGAVLERGCQYGGRRREHKLERNMMINSVHSTSIE